MATGSCARLALMGARTVVVGLFSLLVSERASGAGATADGPPHRVTIEVKGPVALVEIDRPLSFDPGEARRAGWRDEVAVDLALPPGAALERVELRGPQGAVALRPAGDAARARYQASLDRRGLVVPKRSFDDGVDVRLRVAGRDGAGARLRYRFVAPLACEAGRYVLRMPGSLEASPTPADVRVRFELRPGAPAAHGVVVAGAPAPAGAVRAFGAKAPARAPWALSFEAAPAGGPRAAGAPGLEGAVALLAARAPASGGGPVGLAVSACRRLSPPDAAPPDQLLFLVDRSRSVGPGGIAAERELVRGLVESLPPSLRFNAIFFDGDAQALFPVARVATREALDALDAAAAPASLANGTDLRRALAAIPRLAPPEPGARTWAILLTDGALPDRDAAPALAASVRALPPEIERLAVVVVRPAGEDPVAAPDRARLARLLAARGGVFRVVTRADRETAASSLEGLRGAGDVVALEVGALGGARRLTLSDALAPGEGAFASWPAPGGGVGAPFEARGALGGRAARLPLRMVSLPAGVALPGGPGGGWFAEGAGVAALLEPAPPNDEAVQAAAERGEMERSVVKNALSLAFLPRARACYLGRTVTGGRDVELQGRVRLALQLERGEMTDAVIATSTLGRPDIEECVRRAAFAVHVPRAVANDAAVEAVLNLVFRPTTESRPAGPRGGLGDELELIVGPPAEGVDPKALLLGP